MGGEWVMKGWELCTVLAVLLASFVLGLGSAQAASGGERWIVIFDDTVNEAARENIIRGAGGVIIKDLSLVNGKAVLLPLQAASALGRVSGVVRVDLDVIVETYGKPTNPGKPPKEEEPQPAQGLPWGVNRIDAEYAWSYSTGSGMPVAILDTGIDLDHPDLSVVGGYNAVNPKKSPDDDNGHGTHVAGITAALNNEIGVVGVAPDVALYAVKVLNRKGFGFLSDVIDGLGWCVDNGMRVVNMSFGTSDDVQSFHDAVIAANDAEVIQVAAAGNTAGVVGYPAAYDETIATSATDSTDALATFSGYGPEIDIAAPGVDIYSTYKGGGYETLSGTSMAAPHVTGTAALVLAMGLTVETGYGLQTDDDLKAEVLTYLGDPYYGEGLVDAEDSVNGDATLEGDDLSTGAAKPLPRAVSTWGRIKSLFR